MHRIQDCGLYRYQTIQRVLKKKKDSFRRRHPNVEDKYDVIGGRIKYASVKGSISLR
jgi:hypothetical protein